MWNPPSRWTGSRCATDLNLLYTIWYDILMLATKYQEAVVAEKIATKFWVFFVSDGQNCKPVYPLLCSRGIIIWHRNANWMENSKSDNSGMKKVTTTKSKGIFPRSLVTQLTNFTKINQSILKLLYNIENVDRRMDRQSDYYKAPNQKDCLFGKYPIFFLFISTKQIQNLGHLRQCTVCT